MNVEKLNKIIKKYKSNYYHNTSIYERQYESEKNENNQLPEEKKDFPILK